MTAFYVAAAHKSSGKTTLSIGLTAALKRRGLGVQTFKKGPDYIDPLWLSRASGRACHNLDFFTSSHQFIRQQVEDQASGQDLMLVEGNMGLFDGISLDGSDSNAAMAKLLGLPIILIVDCSGTSRGIAPLLVGYQQFDPELNFAGVILNKVAGKRHEKKLREVIEAYTDFAVLGVVHRNEKLQLTERHLGLIPSNEIDNDAERLIEQFADIVEESVDLEQILQIPSLPSAATSRSTSAPSASHKPSQDKLRIAVAMDAAFGFYYPADLQRFAELNVELVPFQATNDPALPDQIDGLFIGGGFPESQIESLSANTSLLQSIKSAIEGGLPSYAECGGLMYLCDDLTDSGGQRHALCGVISASVRMNQRPQGRGYVVLASSAEHPWQRDRSDPKAQYTPSEIQAHEFHYSSLHGLPESTRYAYSMKRGTGIDGSNDGIILYNLLASYTHLRATDRCSWVDDFVSFIKSHKSSKQS